MMFSEFYRRLAELQLKSGTILFVKLKHYRFLKPEITCETSETDTAFQITLKSMVFAKYVALDFKTFDAIFSENYFDLNPDEEKK